MTKNPVINALAAIAYITLVALAMYWGSTVKMGGNEILAPIVILAMFTLSAAMMGYIFLYQPGQMFLDNKRAEGVKLFLQTVGIFGGFTALLVGLVFSGVI